MARWNVIGALLLACLGCNPEPEPGAREIDPMAARLVDRMQEAHARGDWNAALSLADSASLRAPDLAIVPFTRGLILTKLHQYDDARAAYERTLELSPSYRQAWFNLGHNALLQREYRTALTYYEKERALIEEARREQISAYAEQDRRALPAIAAQIGRAYDLMGVPDSAQIAYEEALDLDSTYSVAHAWLSEHYEKHGQFQEALYHAEKALESNPNEVEYAYRVGLLLFRTGQVEDAVPLLAVVVQKWPGHEGAAYNLGLAFNALGREEDGQVLLDRLDGIHRLQEDALQAQRAVEMYPEDPDRWVRLAGLMLKSGYFGKAEEAFMAALARAPGDLSLRNDLANLALVRGDTTLALQRFQMLLHRDSTFADAWLNIGIIYAMDGQTQNARMAWQKVLQYNPDDPDAKAYLARLD